MTFELLKRGVASLSALLLATTSIALAQESEEPSGVIALEDLAFATVAIFDGPPGDVRTVRPSGSGYFHGTESALYLITAGHVLKNVLRTNPQLEYLGVVRFVEGDDSQWEPVIMGLELACLGEANIRHHPNRDVAALRVGIWQGSYPTGPGSYKMQCAVGYDNRSARNLKSRQTIEFDSLRVLRDVVVPGFPSSLSHPELSQFEYHIPIVRKGVVAAKNGATGRIVIDVPIFPGNSGGPVFALRSLFGPLPSFDSGVGRDWALVGIVTQRVPYIERVEQDSAGVSVVYDDPGGLGIVEPVDGILELIEAFERR